MTAPRWTLTERLYLRVGGVALVLVGVIVATIVTAIGFRDDVNRREQLEPGSADAVELSSLLADQLEATMADAPPAAGDDETLRAGRQRIELLVGRLERELAGEQELIEELDGLRADLLAWLLHDSGTGGTDDPVVRDDVAEPLGELVARSDELSVAISERISDATAAARTSRTSFLRMVSAAVTAAILLLVTGTFALRRVVIRPVRLLSSDVAAVAEGEFTHPIRGQGSRELAELAQFVTRMRDRVLSERDQARRAIESLDQQAPAVATLRTLLAPRQSPVPPELDVAGGLVPAEGTLAGDWYDIAARPTGLVVAIGDVCGHGVDAGLLAVRTKFALLDAIDLGLNPAAALELASSRFGSDDSFATALVAEIDLRAGTCRYASAGHTPMLLLRADGTVEQLARTGPLIGLAEGPRPNASVDLKVGDTLVLYTDGVVEARPRGGTQFLEARLLELLTGGADQSAAALTERVLAEVVAHCHGSCPDDATIAVVRVNRLAVVPRVA